MQLEKSGGDRFRQFFVSGEQIHMNAVIFEKGNYNLTFRITFNMCNTLVQGGKFKYNIIVVALVKSVTVINNIIDIHNGIG